MCSYEPTPKRAFTPRCPYAAHACAWRRSQGGAGLALWGVHLLPPAPSAQGARRSHLIGGGRVSAHTDTSWYSKNVILGFSHVKWKWGVGRAGRAGPLVTPVLGTLLPPGSIMSVTHKRPLQGDGHCQSPPRGGGRPGQGEGPARRAPLPCPAPHSHPQLRETLCPLESPHG